MKMAHKGDLALRLGGQEKQSRSILGGEDPAAEIDQSTLSESGIVFIVSVSDDEMNA